jgi:hypothetical protein
VAGDQLEEPSVAECGTGSGTSEWAGGAGVIICTLLILSFLDSAAQVEWRAEGGRLGAVAGDQGPGTAGGGTGSGAGGSACGAGVVLFCFDCFDWFCSVLTVLF